MVPELSIEELKEEWKNYRAKSGVFAKQEKTPRTTANGKKKDEWGFCVSKIQPPNSIFFLGLNPSAPEGHLHESFCMQKLKKNDFKYQRKIANDLGLDFAYWDLFPVRITRQEYLKKKFEKILAEDKGRKIVRSMFSLARLAIETVRPGAVYVCNGFVRDLALYKIRGPMAAAWNDANPLPLFHQPGRESPLPWAGRFKYYYNTMIVRGSAIPVLLGVHLGDGYWAASAEARFAARILKKALDNPEAFYGAANYSCRNLQSREDQDLKS